MAKKQKIRAVSDDMATLVKLKRDAEKEIVRLEREIPDVENWTMREVKGVSLSLARLVATSAAIQIIKLKGESPRKKGGR